MRRLREAVSKHRQEYEVALWKCSGRREAATGHLREVMRIAYNLVGDATKVLLVSVADVKTVLLWCTIYKHSAAAKAVPKLTVEHDPKEAISRSL